MPRHKGVWRIEWRTCDRCGFLFPINLLHKQLGLLIDQKCSDDLSNQYRAKVISDVLSEPGEGMSEQGEMFKGPGENVVF